MTQCHITVCAYVSIRVHSLVCRLLLKLSHCTIGVRLVCGAHAAKFIISWSASRSKNSLGIKMNISLEESMYTSSYIYKYAYQLIPRYFPFCVSTFLCFHERKRVRTLYARRYTNSSFSCVLAARYEAVVVATASHSLNNSYSDTWWLTTIEVPSAESRVISCQLIHWCVYVRLTIRCVYVCSSINKNISTLHTQVRNRIFL